MMSEGSVTSAPDTIAAGRTRSVFPTVVAHADWSMSDRKRWVAIAERRPDGTYLADDAMSVGRFG